MKKHIIKFNIKLDNKEFLLLIDLLSLFVSFQQYKNKIINLYAIEKIQDALAGSYTKELNENSGAVPSFYLKPIYNFITSLNQHGKVFKCKNLKININQSDCAFISNLYHNPNLSEPINSLSINHNDLLIEENIAIKINSEPDTKLSYRIFTNDLSVFCKKYNICLMEEIYQENLSFMFNNLIGENLTNLIKFIDINKESLIYNHSSFLQTTKNLSIQNSKIILQNNLSELIYLTKNILENKSILNLIGLSILKQKIEVTYNKKLPKEIVPTENICIEKNIRIEKMYLYKNIIYG